jgi:hypothetical protein
VTRFANRRSMAASGPESRIRGRQSSSAKDSASTDRAISPRRRHAAWVVLDVVGVDPDSAAGRTRLGRSRHRPSRGSCSSRSSAGPRIRSQKKVEGRVSLALRGILRETFELDELAQPRTEAGPARRTAA